MASNLEEWRLEDYFRVFWLHRGIILASTFICGLLTTVHMAQLPNIYKATARILIETHRARVLEFKDVSAANPWDITFLQTEYQVISSRAVLSKVMENLHLVSFPPFSKTKNPVAALTGIVAIKPVRGTKLVDIVVTQHKPELAARIANGVADAYSQINLERRREMTTGGAQWLRAEVEKMETRMKESQLKLQDFREQYGKIDLGEERQNTTLQRIQALNVSLNKTREDRIEAQAKYREKHPILQELLNKEKELQLALFDAEQQALEMSRLSIQFNALLRETKTSETIYNILLTRLKELTVQEGLESNNVQVVDYATVPIDPVGPDRTKRVVLATLMGFLLGCGLGFLREFFTKTVRTRQDFELLLEIPFLGHVPQFTAPRGKTRFTPRFLAKDPRSPVVETIRSIRTTLEFLLPAGPSHVLLITSALPEEGKSTLSSNLAIALTELGRKTLLIDADMRRPALHKYLKLNLEPGLSGYLNGEADWPELIQRIPDVEGLSVIAAGMSPEQPADLLSGSRFKALIEASRKEYQHILVDAPPILVAADAAVIATAIDGVIYAVRANRTPNEAALAGKQRLIDVGAKIIGGILNGARLELERGYRYYYSSRYYQNSAPKRPSRNKPSASEAEPSAEEPSSQGISSPS